MNQTSIFLLGAVGALAPEIVRLYTIRSKPRLFRWSRFYLITSLLFAILGGVMAFVLPATSYWGALYVGISTPLLVNTVLKKGIEFSEVEYKDSPKKVSTASAFESFVKAL